MELEALTLKQAVDSQTSPSTLELYRAFQVNISSYQLLRWLSASYKLLVDAKVEEEWLTRFFKAPIINKALCLGVGTEILTSSSLYDQALKTIQDIQDLILKKFIPAELVDAILFIAYTLGQYLIDQQQREKAAPFCQIKFINSLLENPDTPFSQKIKLLLYLTLFQTQQTPYQEMDDTILSQIYFNWMSIHLYNDILEKLPPWTYQVAQRQIFTLTQTARLNTQIKWHSIFRYILIESKLDTTMSDRKGTWKNQFFELGKWLFNPTSGDMLFNGNVIRTPSVETWEKELIFRNPDNKTPISSYCSVACGSAIELLHKGLTYRIILNCYSSPIKRFFPQNKEWGTLLKPEDFYSDDASYYEFNQMRYFSEKFSWWWLHTPFQGLNIILCDLESTIPCYALDKEKNMFSIDPNTFEKKETINSISDPAKRLVGSFEDPNYVFIHTPLHKTETSTLSFPFYTDESQGNSLEFIYNPTSYWESTLYPGYKLSQPPPPIKELFPEALYLLGPKGSNKILVPCRNKMASKLSEPKEKPITIYITFNHEKGEIKPTTQAGILLLTYSYFMAGDYVWAFETLNTIRPTESFTPLSVKILEYLFDKKIPSIHPEQLFVLLKAAFLYVKQHDLEAYQYSIAPEGGFLSLRESHLKMAINGLFNVSQKLRLPVRDEISILNRFALILTKSEKKTLIHNLILVIQNQSPPSQPSFYNQTKRRHDPNDQETSFFTTKPIFRRGPILNSEAWEKVISLSNKKDCTAEKWSYLLTLFYWSYQTTYTLHVNQLLLMADVLYHSLTSSNASIGNSQRTPERLPKDSNERSILIFFNNSSISKDSSLFFKSLERKKYTTDGTSFPTRIRKRDLSTPNQYPYVDLTIQLPSTQERWDQLTSLQENTSKITQLDQATEILEALQKKKLALTNSILERANKQNPDKLQSHLDAALIGGQVLKAVIMEDCIQALLSLQSSSYQALNPYLTPEDIQAIAQETVQLMDLLSFESQILRIIKIIEELKKADDPSLQDRLREELTARYEFESLPHHIQIPLRVFSGQTSLIPRKNQIDCIKKILGIDNDDVQIRSLIIELLMGGGKTTLIATFILYYLCKKLKKTVFFIVPTPLLKQTHVNLDRSLRRSFSRSPVLLKLDRSSLTVYKLQTTAILIEEAAELRIPLITDPSTIQCLQLELLALLHDLSNKSLESPQKINLLHKILTELQKLYFLGDEEHSILSIRKEVIFPFGEKQKLDLEEIQLVSLIFQILCSEGLNSIVNLESNDQANMSEACFRKKIIPSLAESLISNTVFKKFIPPSHTKSLCKYISGKMAPFLQHYVDNPGNDFTESKIPPEEQESFKILQDDLEFLTLLRNLSESQDENEKKGADLIALTKYYLTAVLPKTLSQTGGIHYGPPEDERNVNDTVPYTAANSPALTAIGKPEFKICKTFQMALGSPITKEQLLEISRFYRDMAQQFLKQTESETIRETPENAEFFEMFGIHLDDMNDDNKIASALKYPLTINTKLRLANWRASFLITFYPETLRSGPLDFLNMFKYGCGMSGTTSNAPGLPPAFANHHYVDTGLKTHLISQIERAEKNQRIVTSEFKTAGDILSAASRAYPNFTNIRGIIDTGGYFSRIGPNIEVAKQVSSYLKQQKSEQPVDGVLFFDREGQLWLLRLNSDKPEFIGGTSLEELSLKGLDTLNYFVIYGQENSLGVDIPQLPNAVNIVTISPDICEESFLQGLMRLRGLLKSQSFICFITPQIKEALALNQNSITDILKLSKENERIQKEEEFFYYYYDQIENLFRQIVFNQIIKLLTNKTSIQEIQAWMQKLTSFYTRSANDPPYKAVGRLSQETNVKNFLIKHLTNRLNLFKQQVDDKDLKDLATREAEALNQHILSSQVLPKTRVMDAGVQKDTEIEEAQVESDTDKEAEVVAEQERLANLTIHAEIKTERDIYSKKSNGRIKTEKKLDSSDFDKLVQKLKDPSFQSTTCCLSVSEQMQKYNYQKDYSAAFKDSDLFGTPNFFHTTDQVLSFFHHLQRPFSQILVVGNRFCFVSETEASDIREFLTKAYLEKKNENVWLIQPNGLTLVDSPKPPPLDDLTFKDLLLKAHALAGDTTYLIKEGPSTDKWLHTNRDIKLRFLRLHTCSDTHKKETFENFLSMQQAILTKTISTTSICQKRMERLKNVKGDILISSQEEAEKLPAHYISQLTGLSIPFLSREQLQHLQGSQVPYVGHSQISALPPHLVKYIERVDQIMKDDQCQLTETQISELGYHQKDFIPFIPTTYYRNFTKAWQVRAIPFEKRKDIPENLLFLLNETDLRNITKNPEAYRNVALNTPIRMIHGNCLDLFPVDQLKDVSKLHIQEIDRRELIAQLEVIAQKGSIEKGKWTAWINLNMIDFISEEQVQYLTQEQIPRCPNQFVPKLTEDQIQHIFSTQVKWLTGENQIQHCPNNLVCQLTEDQIQHISSTQVKWLTEENQIQHCPYSLVPYLEQAQIKYISENQVIHLKGAAQIQACPNSLVDALSPQQFNNLTSLQISYLTRNQINKIETPDVLAKLPYEKFAEIKERAIIQKVPFSKVQYLTKEQLQQRTWGQNITYVVAEISLTIISFVIIPPTYLFAIPFSKLFLNDITTQNIQKFVWDHPNRFFKLLKIHTQIT